MEKQTSVAIAGMQHFESAREKWAASDLSLPKSLKKLVVAPVFLLETGVTGVALYTTSSPQARNTLDVYKDKEFCSSLRHF